MMSEYWSKSKTPTLDIYLSNLGAYNEGELRGEWVSLPVDAKEFQEAQSRIGIGEERPGGGTYEEMFVTDYDSVIPGIAHLAGETPDFNVLNQIAADYDDLDSWDQEKVYALMEAGEPQDLNELDNLMQDPSSLDELRMFHGGQNNAVYGQALIEEAWGSVGELPDETVEQYFDYGGFGRAVKEEWSGEEVGDDYVMTSDLSFDPSEPDVEEDYELPASLDEDWLEEVQETEPDRSNVFLNPGPGITPILEVELINQRKLDEEGESQKVILDLPVDPEDYVQALSNLGLGTRDPNGTPYTEVGITDIRSEFIPEPAEGWLPNPLSDEPQPSLSQLNQIAADYDALSLSDQDRLDTLSCTGDYPETREELANLIHGRSPEIGNLTIYPGGVDDWNFGEDLIEECGMESLSRDTQEEYFDFELFGRDVKMDEYGYDLGEDYLAIGDLSLDASEPDLDIDLFERDEEEPERHTPDLSGAIARGARAREEKKSHPEPEQDKVSGRTGAGKSKPIPKS